MEEKNEDGSIKYTQYDLQHITGFSRPYIRKIATMMGFVFPRNGIEICGVLAVCANCESYFRRSPSRVRNKDKIFCSVPCKDAYKRGPNHPNWKKGDYVKNFSVWISNQQVYKQWKDEVFAMYEGKCAVTGRDYELDAHHIVPKSIDKTKSLDPENGILINKEVHRYIHKMIHEGKDFQEAIDEARTYFAAINK